MLVDSIDVPGWGLSLHTTSCQRPVIVVLLVAGDRGLGAPSRFNQRPGDLGRDRAIGKWRGRPGRH